MCLGSHLGTLQVSSVSFFSRFFSAFAAASHSQCSKAFVLEQLCYLIGISERVASTVHPTAGMDTRMNTAVCIMAILSMVVHTPTSHAFSIPLRRLEGNALPARQISTCAAHKLLSNQNRGEDDSEWRTLPHVDRAQAIRIAGASAIGRVNLFQTVAVAKPPARTRPEKPRSAGPIDKWPALPVWPVWPTPASPTGGRVRPIAFAADPLEADPFLLLAHHRHSFSPGDPLRAPFRAIGGALGLPYVGE